MNHKQHMMIFAVLIITSVTVEAKDVYKNVDPQGRVEFSDRPSPGGETVDVNPNVVDVAPVKPIQPSPAAPAKAADAPDRSEELGVVPEVESSGYNDDSYDRREKLREAKERREHGNSPVQLPANKNPAKATVHGGPHRK